MALGAWVCHTVHPVVQSALLANVHCNESLIWFKASGFLNAIIIGSSLELSWDILCLVPPDQKGLDSWVCSSAVKAMWTPVSQYEQENSRVGEEPNGKHWLGPSTWLGQIGISDFLCVSETGKTTRCFYYREDEQSMEFRVCCTQTFSQNRSGSAWGGEVFPLH